MEHKQRQEIWRQAYTLGHHRDKDNRMGLNDREYRLVGQRFSN